MSRILGDSAEFRLGKHSKCNEIALLQKLEICIQADPCQKETDGVGAAFYLIASKINKSIVTINYNLIGSVVTTSESELN